jgi:glyoxylase-like metal-dependent hydrolase (beta-lactamase superfamily II)
MTVTLGGKSVELTHVGKGHSDNMIVMRFPAERTIYVCDIVSVRSVGYKTLTDAYFPEWMDSIKVVEDLDFDIMAPCHGKMGTKSDVRNSRRYYEDLYAAVLSAAQAGQSLEEMKESIKLAKYKKRGRYKQFLKLNIEGMHRQIQLHRRATWRRRR